MDTHYDIVHLDRAASTQDAASEAFAATGVPTLVVADHQDGGRGRSGRSWLAPDLALFSSYASVPEWTPEDFPLIPLCTAVAVREAIASETDVQVDLKWPNDLLVRGRKVGGILVEGSGGTVVVGCGVNLAWASPPPYAGALLTAGIDPEASRKLARRIARGWVDGLLAIMASGAHRWPRDAFLEGCVTVGSHVAWDGGGGVAVTIAEDGSLVVDAPGGTVALVSGDVHLLDGPGGDEGPHGRRG